MEKITTLKEADEFILSNKYSPENIQELVKDPEIDSFSKVLLCIVAEVPFETLIPLITQHPNLINVWNESKFKQELLKLNKDYQESVNFLMKQGDIELRDELDDEASNPDIKLSLLESLNKYPFDFSSPQTLESTFDKDVAEFISSNKIIKDELQKALIDINLEKEVLPAEHSIQQIIPFLMEEKYRKSLFDYSSLKQYQALDDYSLEVKEILKAELISKNTEEGILGLILSEPTEHDDFDAILTNFEDTSLNLGSDARNKLFKDFFPNPFYEEKSVKIFNQLSAINLQPKVILMVKDSRVEISLNPMKNKLIQQFFMNIGIRIESILKRKPMDSSMMDSIVSSFSGEKSKDLASEFELMLSSNKNEKNKTVNENIKQVLEELEELFISSLPKVEGYTSFRLMNSEEDSFDFIIDNNHVAIKHEENKYNLVFNSGEDSFYEDDYLLDKLNNFTNNMNAFIQEAV